MSLLMTMLMQPGFTAYDTSVLSDSPYAYYKLDETTGSIASDTSGNGRNGTYAGTITKAVSWSAQGGSTRAPYFDNAADDSEIVLPFTTNLTSACTLEAIILPEAGGGDTVQQIITKNQVNASTVSEFPIQLRYLQTSGELRFELSRGNDFITDVVLSHPITQGNLYHVAGVYRSAGQCELWVNGIMEDSASWSFSISSNARAWKIGAPHQNGGGVGEGRFQGQIGRAALYNSALAGSRIQEHSTIAGF